MTAKTANTAARTPILDVQGRIIATVSQQTTSIGASKVAGFAVKFERRNGVYSWVPR